ncbi:MAG: restriction endonuclease subunit S [Muribaculaceae bacterium]|nr:restriction endonuclease subunit S [Muribaculaceae bacterium]
MEISRIKQYILYLAFRGKLSTRDIDDECAEILLSQIRERRLELIKLKKIKKSSKQTHIYKDGNNYFEQIGTTIVNINSQIPYAIPDNWRWERMGNIGDWGAGTTPAKSNASYYGGNILWLRTGELNNNIVTDTEIKITEKALKECSLRINSPGDILIAMYGATIGKVAIAGVPLTTNQACCACTPFLIDNKYLFYYLMSSKTEFIKKGEGGAQPNISKEKLVNFFIPIPPLKEQKRIVNKIEEIFLLLESIESSLTKISDYLLPNS